MFITKASFFYFWPNLKKVRLHFARLHSRAHRTFTVFEIHLTASQNRPGAPRGLTDAYDALAPAGPPARARAQRRLAVVSP